MFFWTPVTYLRMVKWTNEWTDRHMDGQTIQQTGIVSNRDEMINQVTIYTSGSILADSGRNKNGKQTDQYTDGQADGRTNGRKNVRGKPDSEMLGSI